MTSLSHIRGYSNSDSHKLYDTWKDVESFRRSDVIQYVHHILTLYLTYGTLG